MDINTKIELNNGVMIPQFGFGCWQAESGKQTEQALAWAFEAGYRHIDAAMIYENEESVGKAIKNSGIPREQLFVTTKLWTADIRAGKEIEAMNASLKRLGLEYVDLYLIHWPVSGKNISAWKKMEQIYKSGKARAVGVSNFKVHHMEEILAEAEIVPAADQMEFNPMMQDNDILNFCKDRDIAFEAWSPLGCGKMVGNAEADEIGAKYGKSGAQAILRWILQKGIIVFPKSVHKERIFENANIFDFSLSAEDMAAFDAMNRNERTGPDPDTFNL